MESSILGLIPGYELAKNAKNYIVRMRTYKGKYLRITLQKGEVVIGKFCRSMPTPPSFEIELLDGKKKFFPFHSIYAFDVLANPPSEEPKKVSYAFERYLEYALADFPKPYLMKDGQLDLRFVFGEGSRDCDDYCRHLKMQKILPPVLHSGRRGDFDYLLTLAVKFGYESSRRNLKSESLKKCIPYGRQGFMLTDEGKKNCNLLLVGSGAVNTITRQVLEFYGDNIPVRFNSPESDLSIIIDCDERKLFQRRSDKDRHIGMLTMLPNPFNLEKVVTIAAGVNVTGTQAALLTLCDAFETPLVDMRIVIKGKDVQIPALLVEATQVKSYNGLECALAYKILK